jgi:hypothetical protein
LFSVAEVEVAHSIRWAAALLGLFLFVFAVVALTGPGRMDIVDGQVRYEVARSLVEHGDSVVRDPHAWFCVYPGRDGQDYALYRIPHSLLGVGAIWAADGTGPVAEGRRHVFFLLISAVMGGLLAVAYAVWFRATGLRPAAALLWAAAGVFVTPSWYYSTSTFDDILGATAIVAAVVVSYRFRESRPLFGAACAGLLIGWAVNAKPPWGLFVLAVAAVGYQHRASLRSRAAQLGLIAAGVCLGVVSYKVYDWYKFPPGTTGPLEAYEAKYGPLYTSDPLPGLASMAVSPASGALWYCPTLLLSFYGWRRWKERDRLFCDMTLLAGASYYLFLSFLTFYKGEPSWGPRYLTPLFAVLWLFAPAGACVLSRRMVVLLLSLGGVVQLLGLSLDPCRLYLEKLLPCNYYFEAPWLGFNPDYAHLVQRPREIAAILTAEEQSMFYTTAHMPTYAAPGTPLKDCQRVARECRIVASFRPWWVGQRHLAPEQRPIDLARSLFFLSGIGLAGLTLMVINRNAGETACLQRRLPSQHEHGGRPEAQRGPDLIECGEQR